MSEPFQKAPLMPETRSSATDQEMSKTTLNKGQRQMDSVLKSWGFRTYRDPFQENSSQGLEANKGQKSTPLRRVVCPLEREKQPSRDLAVFAGAFTSLQFDPHRFFKRREPWRRLMQCSFGTCPSRNDETVCLVYALESHIHKKDVRRKVDIRNSPASNNSEPSLQMNSLRFFDVLTTPDFQEKKP